MPTSHLPTSGTEFATHYALGRPSFFRLRLLCFIVHVSSRINDVLSCSPTQMFVMPIKTLLEMAHLVPHQELLVQEKLLPYDPESQAGRIIFVSQYVSTSLLLNREPRNAPWDDGLLCAVRVGLKG